MSKPIYNERLLDAIDSDFFADALTAALARKYKDGALKQFIAILNKCCESSSDDSSVEVQRLEPFISWVRQWLAFENGSGNETDASCCLAQKINNIKRENDSELTPDIANFLSAVHTAIERNTSVSEDTSKDVYGERLVQAFSSDDLSDIPADVPVQPTCQERAEVQGEDKLEPMYAGRLIKLQEKSRVESMIKHAIKNILTDMPITCEGDITNEVKQCEAILKEKFLSDLGVQQGLSAFQNKLAMLDDAGRLVIPREAVRELVNVLVVRAEEILDAEVKLCPKQKTWPSFFGSKEISAEESSAKKQAAIDYSVVRLIEVFKNVYDPMPAFKSSCGI